MRELHVLPSALLATSLVVGLASLLRMARPPALGPERLPEVIRLPAPLSATILTLFALAALVLVVGVARRIRGRRRALLGPDELDPTRTPLPAWMRNLTQILSLLNFVIIAYLCWRGVIPLADLLSLGYGAAPPGPQQASEAPVAAPFLVTWTFGALALVAGLGALILALWVFFGDRLVEWWLRTGDEPAPAPPSGAREVSLEDPRTEPDARRAIIACYGRFEHAAGASGLGRRPWHTPMEFMREALRHLPGARTAVPALTRLFELARFSRHPLGPGERDRAIAALDEITAAIDARRADAARH